jgi:hypothetical protein
MGSFITVHACKELCLKSAGCVGFTFDGQCWPHSSIDQPHEQLGSSLFEPW